MGKLICCTWGIRWVAKALAFRAWRAPCETPRRASFEVEEARQNLRPREVRVAKPLRAIRAIASGSGIRRLRSSLFFLEGARSAERQVPEPCLLRGFLEGLP